MQDFSSTTTEARMLFRRPASEMPQPSPQSPDVPAGTPATPEVREKVNQIRQTFLALRDRFRGLAFDTEFAPKWKDYIPFLEETLNSALTATGAVQVSAMHLLLAQVPRLQFVVEHLEAQQREKITFKHIGSGQYYAANGDNSQFERYVVTLPKGQSFYRTDAEGRYVFDSQGHAVVNQFRWRRLAGKINGQYPGMQYDPSLGQRNEAWAIQPKEVNGHLEATVDLTAGSQVLFEAYNEKKEWQSQILTAEQTSQQELVPLPVPTPPSAQIPENPVREKAKARNKRQPKLALPSAQTPGNPDVKGSRKNNRSERQQGRRLRGDAAKRAEKEHADAEMPNGWDAFEGMERVIPSLPQS